MNKFLLFLTALGLSPLTSMGQIAVGTSNPEPSAAFEVYSTTKGFLPPRMTEFQMLAIPSPVGGLLIYCTNCIDKGVYIYHDLEFLNAVTGRSGHAYIVNTFVEASSNPAADGTPSLTDLTIYGITNTTGSQAEYEEAIADASPSPTTLWEIQNIIDEVNTGIQILIITSNATNPASNGLPSLDQLTNIGITGVTGSQVEYEEAIADASPTPTTLEELQAVIDEVNTGIQILNITANATNPASNGVPSLDQLTNIGITNTIGSQAEYEEAIADASPTPTTLEELQAVIDEVNTGIQILNITANATNPASNGVPSLDQLTNIGITNTIGSQVEYEEAIADASPTPTTLEELQAVIDEVNTGIQILNITANATNPASNGVPSLDQLTNIGITNTIGSQAEYEEAIADASPTPTTLEELQAVIDEVNTDIQILNITANATNPASNGVPSLDQLTNIGITNTIGSQAEYEEAIADASPTPTTLEELQAVIDEVNTGIQILNITANATNPASNGVPSLDQLTNIGITNTIGSQVEYEEAIADASPTPTTLEELQAVIDEVNTDIQILNITANATNPASNGLPSLDQLTNIGITGMTESQTYYEEAIADASPSPTTLEELQNIIQIANITLPPVIKSGSTANDLVENTGAEQEIYTIIAYDLIGIDSYSIGGTDSSSFTINLNSGVVTLIENPDFETQAIYSFYVIASDGAGNSSAPKNVTLAINDLDDEAPIITSLATANTISVNSGAGQEIYTVTASDNVGVTSYAIGGTDASAFTINENTGVVTLVANPSYDQQTYTFEVTATDAAGYTSVPLTVSLTVDNLVAWGQVRYIMFRGTDANGQYNNIGELDILDTDGNDLIDNGTLDANDFTYRYGGGYYSSSSGVDLFDETPSDAYANNAFSNSTGQKWVLIDLGQTVEVGSLTIQARSNSTNHINRITHMTVFTSNRNDTGFAYSGTENTNNNNENLVLERSIDQMKLDPSLKWRDLDNYSTSQTSNNYTKGNQAEDAIAPVITSLATANAISENSGAGQEIYTVTATDNVGVTSYAIGGERMQVHLRLMLIQG